MRYIAIASSLLLAACTHVRNVPVDHIETITAAVPVATGCVAKEGRPKPPVPIKGTVTPADWKSHTVGARAAAIQAQAGRRMNYEDEDRAATSACH